MTRDKEPTKDVTTCDKHWGAGSKHRSNDFRMRKLTIKVSINEFIVYEKGTQGTETSKYLEEKKANAIL